MDQTSGIPRRTLLQAMAASLLPGLPALAANPDLRDPEDLLTTFIRLAGSLDDRLIIWWMDGMRYGVVDAQATLLFGMKVGMFHRFIREQDGRYRVAMFELTYYTDLQSGQLLDTFDNPYTGETNRVRHVRLGPEIRFMDAGGIVRPTDPMVKEYASNLGPALINNDDIWIPLDVEATIQFPKPTAPSIILNHYTTVHGNLQNATDPARTSAPAEINFQNVLKWEPFMRMGDHPGHMMSRAAGRKLESVDELPADYAAIASREHGKYFDDPEATLDKLLQKS